MDYSGLLNGRDESRSLYEQLRDSLENAIESGELTVGERLPSERELAAQLKLSRTTIVNAYRELESKGLVRSWVGRGTFICAKPEPGDAPFAWRGKVSARFISQNNREGSLRQLMGEALNPNLISFAAGAPSSENFPLNAYLRLTEKTLKQYAKSALGLAPTEGQPTLRQATAKYFGTKPERILIISGSQQGIDLVSRCLIDAGDTVIIDRPGYVGAIYAFRAAGANLVGWDVSRWDLDELEDLLVRYRPKLIFTNPTFHNPTGRTMMRRERQDLLKLAARYHTPIIEDDPFRETYLDTQPPPPTLYELDTQNIVIHINSFSKVLAPGLRLGWLAASEYIVDQLASVKQYENLFTEGIGQLVVAEMINSGLFAEHLHKLRKEHAKKRDLLKRALQRHIQPQTLKWNDPRGGEYFWCRLGRGLEAGRLFKQAVLQGVAFTRGELLYPDDGGGKHELRFCFSSVESDKIEEGIKRLRSAFDTFDLTKMSKDGSH